MIKPWIFEFFGAPHAFDARFDAAASHGYFDAYLDLWASAEPAGFEGIFFSEHHFGAAYSPAPNLLIANVAARTKRLRLGTLGMVAPYHTPWQLIEEIGMLDHLTGGRLEIGTAAGIPNEMAKVGLGPDEARARNDEVLDILDAALSFCSSPIERTKLSAGVEAGSIRRCRRKPSSSASSRELIQAGSSIFCSVRVSRQPCRAAP